MSAPQKWTSEEYREAFKILKSEFIEATAAFYLLKTLQKKENEELFNVQVYFWSSVLEGLKTELLVRLARSFEDTKYTKRGKVVSVYSLLQHCTKNDSGSSEAQQILKKNETPIRRLKRLRDEQLVHSNMEALSKATHKLNLDDNLKVGDVEDILESVEEILTLLCPDGAHWSMFNIKNGSIAQTEEIVKKLKQSR